MSTAVLVACEGVTRVFGRGPVAVAAVRDVTCALHSGQRVAVMGPSGSGKSTLIHLLAGIDVPTEGAVTWPGLDPSGGGTRAGTGVVFQGPSLLHALDVRENIALPLLLAGEREPAALAAAGELLDDLGLAGISDALPEELSGGQAQRAAIARALVTRPRLLLADEPTGQLDRATAAEVMDLLLRASERDGAGVVVTTHDPVVARRLPETWTMHDGALTSTGPCSP